MIFQLLSINTSFPKNINQKYEWEAEYNSIIKFLPPLVKVHKITPLSNKNYKNRIINFIKNVNESVIKDVKVLKVKTQPETDLIFIKKKLYIISKIWNDINENSSKKIIKELTAEYGKPVIQKYKTMHIYSFKINNAKMFLYYHIQPDGNINCKLHYYTKKLFKILFMN